MKVNLTTIDDVNHLNIKTQISNYEKAKRIAIENGNEPLANDYWRKIEALQLNVLYIQTFNKIMNKEYRSAWCDLEQCEIKAKFITMNSDESFLASSKVLLIQEMVAKWQQLFPYNLFFSPGFIVGYRKCGICDHKIRPRSRCQHRKGNLYNGELCVHTVHDMEIQEISLVTKPIQKYSIANLEGNLNYSLVDYLSKRLTNAFEHWDVQWIRKKFPIDKFSSVAKSSECPCKSGKQFSDCCIAEKEIEIPHVNFLFNKELPLEKQTVKFPY